MVGTSQTSRALLLTDVVDSTALTARLGDEDMAALWAAHDRMARDLLRRCGGREIDKTDGMLLLFGSVADAVEYAKQYHARLADLPSSPRARAGLHLADVILRENDAADVAQGAKPLEVEGLAKSVAARVMALAQGGQTLLTASAAEALRQAGRDTCSCGHWVVKGVADPIELFELAGPAWERGRPPDSEKAYQVLLHGNRWQPTSQLPNNLPQQVTALYGREGDLDHLKAQCRAARLVTLAGMGGMGKTQLAVQVARELRAEFADGTWFVDLQAVRDPALVAAEAAQVLGIREEAGRALLATLRQELRGKRLLLVLDNCEQVIGACADLAHVLLEASPHVHVIATSREPLAVPGERPFAVRPLPLPREGSDAADILASPAAQLFLARAPHLSAATGDAAQVGELGRLLARLEGIPLAIELAAARSRAMSLVDINRRLDGHRLEVLTQGGRARAQRQQTLAALLEWSYGLLTPEERTAFESLTVFAGGFNLEAGQELLGAGALDLVASLVDKSLLVFEEQGGDARYRMLETVREYGAGKLADSGRAIACRQRHADWFFRFAKDVNVRMRGFGLVQAVLDMGREQDNVRAAMALALEAPSQPLLAVKFAVAMQGYWLMRGYGDETVAYLQAAMQLPAVMESDIGRGFALYVLGALVGGQGDVRQAIGLLDQSLEVRRRAGAREMIAASLSTGAYYRLQAGDPAGAIAMEQEALALFVQLQDRQGECICHEHLGQAALFQGDRDGARVHIGRSLAIAREVGFTEVEAETEVLLGQLQLPADRAVARAHFDRARSICEQVGISRGLAVARRWLARCCMEEGADARAREHLAAAAQVLLEFSTLDELLPCLEDAVRLVLDAPGAPAIAAAIAAARERLGLVRAPSEEARWEETLRALRARGDAVTFGRAWQQGLELSVPQAATQFVLPALLLREA